MIQDEITFTGHTNVLSTHSKTIEITKAPSLSLRGDCIIGVNANKGCRDLKPALRDLLRQPNLVVKIEIEVSDIYFAIHGRSDSRLSLLNNHDIVIRKSNFACPRTVAISCNKSSSDIPRHLVYLLRNPGIQGLLRIGVE
jgi:uncharacterized protein